MQVTQFLRAAAIGAITVMAFAQEGRYRITSGREIISECYGYSFRVPDRWTIYPSQVPLFSTRSQGLRGDELVPMGSAEITFSPLPPARKISSVQEAVELDKNGALPGSLKMTPMRLPEATETTQVTAVSFDQDVGDRAGFLHYSKVYMNFRGRVARMILAYRKGDPKAMRYERDLLAAIKSFGPLWGPDALDGGCKLAK